MAAGAFTLEVLLLAALVASAAAGCPFAGRKALITDQVKMPEARPSVQAAARKLQAAPSTVSPSYAAAMRLLVANFETAIGRCQMSPEGMAYNDGTPGALIKVDSDGVFFPAATWLRAFFHDAGTFIKSPSKDGPKGGPNGSLGVGCTTNPCGIALGAPNGPVQAAPGTTCANGDAAVGGFSDGLSYCCPLATQCLSHGQSPNTPLSGAGLTIPVCLTGSQATVELCRAENFNLLPTIQFFRGRQNNPAFQWTDTDGSKKPVSLADIFVAGAAVAVKQCSGGALNLTMTMGRPEAQQADDTNLPSPTSILEDRHNSVFQQMGLNKNDMVTMVVGSHSIGGFRHLSSPGLTNCPFVPFDCSTSGQISTTTAPFDNNVFKVACNGQDATRAGVCDWSNKCTNPSVDETAQGCPFTGPARAAFASCNSTSYPAPGLVSDIFLCSGSQTTRQRMLNYASDQDFFFKSYAAGFDKLASLGYRNADLTVLA